MKFFVFLSVFILTFGDSICEEPQCSKFPYEEQLLDKMIRMEIKVEAMEKEILNTNQEVLKSLEAMKTEREEIRKMKEGFEKKVQELTDQMTDNVKHIKDTLLVPTVAFKARGPVDTSLDMGQTIIFATLMLNEGGAYDNVTGIFTVPVAGTYLFTIHLCTHSTSNAIYYGIVYDNNVYTSGRFYENDAYVCFSADAILVLKTGQKVWVKCLRGSTTSILYEYTSNQNDLYDKALLRLGYVYIRHVVTTCSQQLESEYLRGTNTRPTSVSASNTKSFKLTTALESLAEVERPMNVCPECITQKMKACHGW